MKTIQVLDTKTINKIAAGEVVESPKSVVKELIENSIDAGATAITVGISDGGTTLIRITDNGKGISKEDLEVAFLPHSTSKLTKVEDLESIFTLGFRGEALASIASVAQVEFTTKTENDDIGNVIEIHGGEIKNSYEIASSKGSTISVKNLFYNVIARRKFLKKPATESSYISDLLNKYALGYPNISFKYINNGAIVLYTNGNGDIKAGIFQVYGRDITANMIPIYYKKGEIEISGMIGKPELSRNNRNYENLFINGRFIKNNIISKGIEDGYKTRLMTGKFPVFIINLVIDPSFVDVNVHPAKLEVRFKDEDLIYDFFIEAITKTLEKELLIPKVSLGKDLEENQIETKKENQTENQIEIKTEAKMIKDKEIENNKPDFAYSKKNNQNELDLNTEKTAYQKSLENILNNVDKPINTVKQKRDKLPIYEKNVEKSVKNVENEKLKPLEIVLEAEKEKFAFFNNYKIIGQIFATYWLVEQNQSIYMIDQHAAHERVLFEKIMNNLKNNKLYAQKLLMPIMLNLDPMEVAVVEENINLLDEFGFQLEKYTEGEYSLKSVPYILGQISDTSFFMEIINELMDNQISSVYDLKINAVATKACKAAVKGNSLMAKMEVDALMEQLLELENPFSCPHGRPVIIEMTKYEIEKLFKRVQN